MDTPCAWIAAIFLLAPAAASAVDRFVAVTNGSNPGNDCTAASQPCRTIQYAINISTGGDRIVISDGTYTEPLSTTKSLSFVRRQAGTRPIIQAAEQPGGVNLPAVRAFALGGGSIEVSFNGLLIRHGKGSANSPGGGIFCNRCVLDLQNMFVRSNSSTTEGGGIFITHSPGESNFRNVTIEDNEAANGGGLRAINSDLRLGGNTRIHRNAASVSGGGAFLTGGTATFNGVTIGGELTASGNGNTAGIGGGMFLAGTTAAFSDVLIRDNSAQSDGGGIHALSSNLDFTDTLFQVNHAGGSGGGLYMTGTSNLAASGNVVLTSNRANENGGGMYIDGGSAGLNDVLFFLNQAVTAGGGLYNTGNVDRMVLENVQFRFNAVSCGGITACSGGGMHIQSSSPVLANVMFESNRAESTNSRAAGGGLSISGGSPVLTNAVFFANETTESSQVGRGGALTVEGGSFPTLVNVTIAGNKANASSNGGGGGIAVSQPASPLLVNTIVWGNTASAPTRAGNEFHLNPDTSADLVFSLYRDRDGEGDIAVAVSAEFNPDDDSFSADPLFVDAGNGDLRLQPASPAVDNGVPDFSPILFPGGPDNPVDLDGNPRFDGKHIDIGAYELQTSDEIFGDRFEQ